MGVEVWGVSPDGAATGADLGGSSLLIARPRAGDVSFKCLPYQLSMVRDMPTMVVTVTGNQGSIPEREHEKRLPHPRKAAGAQITHSWLCPSPPDRGLSQSGCQAFTGTRRCSSERPWSRVV